MTNQIVQSGFDFPVSLTEKYRPATIGEFVGLHQVRLIMSKLCARPYASAWLFAGPSGTGKTSMAKVCCETMNAEVHQVPAQECDLAKVEWLWHQTHFVPRGTCHAIVIDELDRASNAAQTALLSKLDPNADFFPQTVVFATTNDTSRLEPRLLSRFRVLEFAGSWIAQDVTAMLQRIWDAETDSRKYPNFAEMLKDKTINIRAALMSLEIELLAA